MNDGVASAPANWCQDGYARSGILLQPAEISRAVEAMDRVIAGEYRSGLPPFWRSQPPGPIGRRLIKIDMPHLCDPDLFALVRNPALAAWAASVIGADSLQVWAVQLLVKPSVEEPGCDVGWHQDAQYWPYWQGEVLTAWLALSDVAEDSGPVRMVKRSHAWGTIGGGDFFSDLDGVRKAMAAHAGGTWEEEAIVLPAGAASLHHRLAVHGSGPNRSGRPRRSLAIHMRSGSAVPAAGVDDYYIRDLDDPIKAPRIWPSQDR